MGKRDRFFLFIAGLAFVSSCYLFFRRESYNLQTKLAEQIGQLLSYENEVRYKQVSSIDWQKVSSNMDLLAGDQIFTSDNAIAVVKLINGVVLNLKPNTLVKLELDGNNLNLNYLKGLMEVDLSNSIGNIKINGKSIQKGSKNSKLKIYQQNDKTLFNVQDGDLTLGNKALSAGDELDAKGNKKNGDELITLLGPEDNYLFSPLKQKFVKFKWKSPRGAKILTLEMASDPEFDNIVHRKRTYNESYLFKIPKDGKYYWRVRAPGISSPIAYFNVRNLPRTKLLYPKVEEQLKVKLKQNLPVEFSWKGDKKQKYLLTVYIPNDGKKMQKKIFKTKGTKLETKFSELGRYLWEVKPDHPKGVKSRRRPFRLRPNEFVKIKSPGKNFRFDATKTRRGIDFELFKKPRSRSVLYVSRDVTFEEVVKRKFFKDKKFNLNFDSAGEYFYKIRSTIDRNYTTDVFEMTVINWIAKAFTPRNDERLQSQGELTEVNFKWKALYKGRVLVQVAKDAFFKSVVWNDYTRDNKISTKLGPGKYYWRVRATDPNLANFWKQKPAKLFSVLIPPTVAKAKLKSPDIFADEIRIDTKEAYRYKIPAVLYTQMYTVEIIADGKRTSFETKNPEVKIKGKFQGVWEYRYKVIDKWGRESELSDWGKIVFPVAPNY